MQELRVCPKCNYQRTPNDDKVVPENECPKCGVIYEKVVQKKETSTNRSNENDVESHSDEPGCGIIGCFGGTMLGVIGAIMWTFIKCTFSPSSCHQNILDENWSNFWTIVPISFISLSILGFIIDFFGQRSKKRKRRSKRR